jgi:hypothetical protein
MSLFLERDSILLSNSLTCGASRPELADEATLPFRLKMAGDPAGGSGTIEVPT